MKKYLIWIGAAILVMALASPSMAQFKSWGHLEVFSYWEVNKTFNKDANDANYQGIGMRYRFNLGYGDPKTVMAVLGFEANSRGFGETSQDAGPSIYASGPTGAGTSATTAPVAGNASSVSMAGKGSSGDWGTDTIGLQVRHAYLDFTIPNTPLTMQVGLQAQSIGGFLGRFFMLKDVPAFVLNGNFAPHTISAFWWKGIKGNYYMDNDLDYYGLRYRLAQKMLNVEAWFVYGNDRRTAIDSWTLNRSAVAGSTTQFNYAITETLTPRPYEQKPWWLGANVPITAGNWKFEPTAIYLGGSAQSNISSAGSAAGLQNRDFSAYLGDLMVSYRLGPGLKFLGEAFYATGVDNNKNGPTDNVTAWQTPSPSPDGSENRNVFGQFWSVFYFYNTDFGYYSGHQLSPAGHMFGRGNVEFNPLAWLNLNFNYLYIMNSANKYVGHISGATTFAAPAPGMPAFSDKTFIGQEVNVIAKIALYKDFVYTIGFGYFFPGDVYDTPATATTGAKTADQAWNLLTNLKYAF